MALGVLAGTRASRAQDQAPQLELVWQAPPGCPDEAAVRSQSEALLPEGEAEAVLRRSLWARARVSRAEDGRWLLELRMLADGIADHRQLAGDTCQALVDSAAVILSMQMQRSAPEKPPVLPLERREPDPSLPSRPRAARARPSLVQLTLAGTADSAALPAVALGGQVALAWTPGRFQLSLRGELWLAQSAELSRDHAGRARFNWRTGALSLCHATWGLSVRFGPCIGGELGRLSARSTGVRVPDEAAQPWLAAVGGISFWAPLGSKLLLASGVALVVPLSRPRFVIEGIGDIHQPRQLGARCTLGLGYRF